MTSQYQQMCYGNHSAPLHSSGRTFADQDVENFNMKTLKCCLVLGRSGCGNNEDIYRKARQLEEYRLIKEDRATDETTISDCFSTLSYEKQNRKDQHGRVLWRETDKLYVTNKGKLYGSCFQKIPVTKYAEPQSVKSEVLPKTKTDTSKVKEMIDIEIDGGEKSKNRKAQRSRESFSRPESKPKQYSCLARSTGLVSGEKCLKTDKNSNYCQSDHDEIHCSHKKHNGAGTFSCRSKQNSLQKPSHNRKLEGTIIPLESPEKSKFYKSHISEAKRTVNKSIHELDELSRKLVMWAHHVERPLNCWLGRFGVPHVGVIVTTEDGGKWLIHKARINGKMDTVVTDVKTMASNWSVKASRPVSNFTVGDFIIASGRKYNLLSNNCWHARKRMMTLCDWEDDHLSKMDISRQ